MIRLSWDLSIWLFYKVSITKSIIINFLYVRSILFIELVFFLNSLGGWFVITIVLIMRDCFVLVQQVTLLIIQLLYHLLLLFINSFFFDTKFFISLLHELLKLSFLETNFLLHTRLLDRVLLTRFLFILLASDLFISSFLN